MMTLSDRLRSSWASRRDLWILVLILLIAGFFRLFRLGSVPPGLHPDEAANGLDIIRMIDHHDFRVLYATNGPREALFFYLQAPFVLLLGASPLALRLAPAVLGVATVVALYLLVRLIWGRRAALTSAFILAVLPWAVTLNRDGFRANLVPLVTILIIYCYALGIRDRSYRAFAAAGALLGVGFYTYLSYRVFPFVVLGMVVLLWARYGRRARAFIRPMILSWVVAAVMLIPLGIYGLAHPGDLGARAGGVSVLNRHLNHGDPIGATLTNVGKTALMFTVRGDTNYRQNLGGLPLLDPVTGMLFIVGIVYFISRIRKPAYALVLGWLGVMVLPNILSNEGIPHALRSIGAIPPTVIIAGVTATWAWSRSQAIFQGSPALERTLILIVGVLAIGTVYYSYERYFVVWAREPATWDAYSHDMVSVAGYLKAQPEATHRYAVIDGYSDKTVRYLTWRRAEYTRVEPRAAAAVELPVGRSALAFGAKQRSDLERFKLRYPGGRETPHTRSLDDKIEFVSYEVTR